MSLLQYAKNIHINGLLSVLFINIGPKCELVIRSKWFEPIVYISLFFPLQNMFDLYIYYILLH